MKVEISLSVVFNSLKIFFIHITPSNFPPLSSILLPLNLPETFVHEILDGTRRSYPDAFFVENGRAINAPILCLEHVDEVADVVRDGPEDKLALFISTRQWTNDIW
jgi:hypothetical protein